MFRRRSPIFDDAQAQFEPSSNLQFGGPGRGRFHLLPIVLFGIFAIGYYFTHQETVPITGRKQIVGMSPAQEADLGLQSYREVLSSSRVASQGPEVQLVRSVGERIAQAADAPDFQWEFNVLVDDTISQRSEPGRVSG